MIKTIEKVTINGQNQSFGGYIYNIAYNPSFSDGPSTLVINFISESGTYIEPVLSVKKSYNIKIGKSISLDFFAVSWKMNKTPGGRTLEVKFIDASFILDKIFVGLHKQHGMRGPNGNCLIIVGQELNPCDANRDGVVDVTDLKYLVDGCDPCPDCGPGRDPLTRCQDINDTQLLDVSYNFKELITEIKAKGIQIANVPQTNDKYLSQYTGTLRSVLQSWGADYGFNFYWENNKLNFIDSKQKIIVNVNPPPEILLEQSNSKTLEGTQSRASISRYQRQGERKDYPCESSNTTVLLPLLLKDLFLPIVTNVGGARWRETYKQDQIDLSCVFAHYDQTLRDSFWWFNQHHITGYHAAVAKIGQPLTGLADYKILKVIGGIPNSAYFAELKALLTDPDLKHRFETKGGYFVVMSGSEQQKDKQYAYEKRLSDEFIGKYFYRPYTPKLCGGQYNQTKNVSLVGEGGAIGHLYEAGDNIKNAPIFAYDFHPDSTVGRMITKNIFMSSPEGYTIAYAQPPATPNQYLNHAIALLEHTPKWFPEVGDTGIKPMLDYYNNRIFATLDAGRPDILNTIMATEFGVVGGKKEDVKLYVVFSGAFVGSRPHATNHLDAQVTTQMIISDGQTAPLGLISNACAYITVQNELGVLTLETPSQGVSGLGTRTVQGLGGPVTIPTTVSYEGYRALVQQKYSEVVNIPKVQTVLQNGVGSCADNTLSFDVNFRDINDTDIKILNSGAACIPDSGVILLAHQTFNQGLTFSISDPKEDVTYSIAGIDIPGVGADLIKNGLVGLDISISNDGVVSNYTFSSRPPQPPKIDIVQRLIESNRPPPTKA